MGSAEASGSYLARSWPFDSPGRAMSEVQPSRLMWRVAEATCSVKGPQVILAL